MFMQKDKSFRKEIEIIGDKKTIDQLCLVWSCTQPVKPPTNVIGKLIRLK